MGPKARILIVDDDVRMCNSLRLLLSLNDYEICSAHSGREARGLLSEKEFDIVLLDVVLPDANGRELLAHIRTFATGAAVIVITGYGDLSAPEALGSGVCGCVKKPFEYEALLRMIQDALGRKENRPGEIGSAQTASEIDQATRDRSRRCGKHFSCLDHQTSDMCEIIYSIGSSTLITLCGAKSDCPYCRILSGYQGICCCPTRIELHTKYGI